MKRLGIVLLALTLPWHASGFASAGETLRLGVEDTVRRALESSPDLRALETIVIAADRGLEVAASARRPTVDVLAGYRLQSSVPEFITPVAGGGTQTIFPDIQNNWTARVEAILPLYTGGRTAGSIDAAGFDRDAAVRDVAARELDTAYETRRAYWSLVVAIETERVLRAALASFDAHLADATQRERFGLAARNEVLAVRVERERGELARIRAANAVATIQTELARLLDLVPGTTIVPVESLEASGPFETDAESLLVTALASRPERAALEARMAAVAATEHVARAPRRPQVVLAAGYDYARPNRVIVPPVDRWDDSWDVSVRLSYRLYDGGRTAADAARAAASAEALRERLDGLELDIRRDVTARALDLDTAVQAVAVSEANVAFAEENLRIARDRYREGVIPSSELLDAETALLDAGLDRTQAIAGVRLSQAALDRAIGR